MIEGALLLLAAFGMLVILTVSDNKDNRG